jgi:hypothetical protein
LVLSLVQETILYSRKRSSTGSRCDCGGKYILCFCPAVANRSLLYL